MQFFAVGMRRTRALSPLSSGPKSVDHAVDRSPDLTRCFCVSPIGRASPSITSATMEQLIGAKPAGSCFRSMRLGRRKPQEKGRRFRVGNPQEFPVYERDEC